MEEFLTRPEVINCALLWVLTGILLVCMYLIYFFRKVVPPTTYLLIGSFLLATVASALSSTVALAWPDDEGLRFLTRYVGVALRTSAIIFLLANIAYGVRVLLKQQSK